MRDNTSYIDFESRFDRFPAIPVSENAQSVISEWPAIAGRILEGASEGRVAIETYQGVDIDRIKRELGAAFAIADTRSLMKPPADIETMVFPDVTDDPVFGRMTCLDLQDFFDPGAAISAPIVIGPGATLLVPDAKLVVYADMPRWEIQQRQRAMLVDSLGLKNRDDDAASLYKRSYFVDWRVLDRHKKMVLPMADLYLETVNTDKPLMIAAGDLMRALDQVALRPFELMPFFDPGVWGGHWMEEVCRIDAEAPNQAWCFNCVPEENSLLLQFGQYKLEIPAINLVFFRPRQLLGEPVQARFGDEFPIRFDFLDTMGGQNLSFQVHPTAGYMYEHFGVPYTQDESYYILDAGSEAVVYLGLKESVNSAAMQADLENAQNGVASFPANTYVNTWPARKHDHFLIPAGTPHCSGADSMVLEISATPYIFTFKLWDWDRVGMDGKPRPINIERGLANIQWHRDTEWIRANLVDRVEPLCSGDGWREERTGLHELEFIETRRYWFTAAVDLDTGGMERGSVHVLNLVEGQEITVESRDGAFSPMVVRYAETLIVPAAVGNYKLRPSGASEGQEVAVVCAWVRF
jgi:mannose-6-phosphate isomerase class I